VCTPSIIHTSLSVTDNIGSLNPTESILPDDVTELIENYDISDHTIDFDENLFDLKKTLLPEPPSITHHVYGHSMDHDSEILLDTSILQQPSLLVSKHLLLECSSVCLKTM
jgi:hypothetical protein